MVNEFCGFKHGVIGTDKMPADTTLNNMKKADLIKLLHTAQHNYETLMWFYNNAVKANMSQLNNNGWIPRSERLPEILQWVLIQTTQGDMDVVRYIGETECWGNDFYHRIHPRMVQAWMPLPAPYQPKGE